MSDVTTWGLVATIKAPLPDILRFAAYHLEAGAHRLYLYLDDADAKAEAILKAHPKIRVTTCDAAHWDKLNKGRRPAKHQVRQTFNATHAYSRRAEVDWLIHMDVDEFLVPERPVADILRDQTADTLCARIRPMEALAPESGPPLHYKAFVPNGPERLALVRDLYPTYGETLKGGFLSHLAGKVFLRTGLPGIRIQIHNAFQNDVEVPTAEDTPGIALAHLHAKTWEQWIAAFRYRLEKGSYRAELGGKRAADRGKPTVHEMFRLIFDADGEAGLRAFFDEVCADTSALRARLDGHGLLRRADLALDSHAARHFPQHFQP